MDGELSRSPGVPVEHEADMESASISSTMLDWTDQPQTDQPPLVPSSLPPSLGHTSTGSRLLPAIRLLIQHYEAALQSAPDTVAALVFAQHRRDLEAAAAHLATIDVAAGAAATGATGGEPAFSPKPLEAASGNIWHDARAFGRRLHLLRYFHECIARDMAALSTDDPSRLTQPPLTDTTRLHLWQLARLETDPGSRQLDPIPQREIPPQMETPACSQSALAALGNESGGSRKGGLPIWQLRRIGSLVNAAPGRQISVPVLAEQVGLSPSHFTRAFKISMGTSPARWLLAKRLETAKELLTGTDHPLAEIAATCGFSEASHFTRRFRQVTGMTPGTWRRRYK